jgi:hypothetical protein
MFGCFAMVFISFSEISFGCDVANRNLIQGKPFARSTSRSGKSVLFDITLLFY